MKTCSCALLLALWLTSCGKEEAPKAGEAPPASAPALPAAPPPKVTQEKKAPIITPQGKLPQMDPEKAKLIAVPNTPKDPEPKQTTEAVKSEKSPVPAPETEVKKAAPASPAGGGLNDEIVPPAPPRS